MSASARPPAFFDPDSPLAAAPADALHGAVVRPPRMAWDGARYRGQRLAALDASPAWAMPGVVAVVREGSFVGVAAASPLFAQQAADSLRPAWQAGLEVLSADAADASGDTYAWRLPARAADPGKGATAWCLDGRVAAWVPCAPAHVRHCRDELAHLLELPADRVSVVPVASAQGVPPHPLDAIDAAADAALLSRAAGRPVRVAVRAPQLAGAAAAAAAELALRIAGPGDAGESMAGQALPGTEVPPARPASGGAALVPNVAWAVRPSLARMLCQPDRARPVAGPSALSALPVLTPKGAVALPQVGSDELNAAQVFAQESALAERAARQGMDPLDYRLAGMPPGPARSLIEQLAERAPPRGGAAEPGRLRGRGFACAHVREDEPERAGVEAWSAWMAEVSVEPLTGRIDVTRVMVGRDSRSLEEARGASIDDDPRLLDAARRLLAAPARFDDWGGLAAPGRAQAETSEKAATELALPAARPPVSQGELALDGVATLPAAAAIANAIYDATGVRLRRVPFDSEQLRLALRQGAPRRAWLRRGWGWLAAGIGGLAGLAAMAWPAKPAIAPTAGPDVSLYSEAAIERGRLVALAGDCVVCHTAPGGQPNAGGLGLETPFGTIYSTNITPDNETGIGRWSYTAFERAMREGVHRDGRQLYPAFPYTAFAKMTDGDIQALYGYLMSQPPVRAEAPETKLAFPYNLRAALAGWNLLFHDNSVYQPDPAKSLEWNRGAYLAQGAGHCGACHTPRNALGAEKAGIENYLAGGEAEGWEAPPLNRLASAEVPWNVDDLTRYLRTGSSARHGVAAGPMAPVIHGLAELPESDVRAIAVYLMDLPGAPAAAQAEPRHSATALAAAALPAHERLLQGHANGERIYQNACAVCHEPGQGPALFGVKPLLGLNTNLHSATPDNLVQVILHGIQEPANGDLGYMPGFKDSLDDRQVAELVGYLRARFAPGQPAWEDVASAIGRAR